MPARQRQDEVMLRDLAEMRLIDVARDFHDHDMVLVTARLDALPFWLPPSTPDEIIDAARRFGCAGHPEEAGFLARRRIARGIAASILGMDAARCGITTTPAGAPVFAQGGMETLHLSLAARCTHAAIAVARRPVGVDIERAIDPGTIPLNILTGEERAELAGLPALRRSEAFTRLWALKEAGVKALGQGFGIAPEDVRVTHLLTTPQLFLRAEAGNHCLAGANVLTWQHSFRFNAQPGDVVESADRPFTVAVVLLAVDT